MKTTMKRTRIPKEKTYDINHEPVILSKVTLDILLKQDTPLDLISLYCFYYYTAKWQKTNSIKATTGYAAQGLKCGKDKIRKAKKKLIELGFIEDRRGQRNKRGETGQCYIFVKFIWWDKEKLENINESDNNESDVVDNNESDINESDVVDNNERFEEKSNKINGDTHTPSFPQCGRSHSVDEPTLPVSHSVDDRETNALSTSNLNALNTNIKYNIYTLFLEKWNEQKIITHKKITSKMKKTIDKILKTNDYSQEEIFKSFQNYEKVLHSSNYYWSYTWTLQDFLNRGLDKFVDESNPLDNFKEINNQSKQSDKQTNKPVKELTRESLCLYDYEGINEAKKLYNQEVSIWCNSGVWPSSYSPDKEKIFTNLIEIKRWIVNVIHDRYYKIRYHLQTIHEVTDRYIDWIMRQSWLDEPGRKFKNEDFMLPSHGLFKLFMKDLEGDIDNTKIRSRGWGDDEDIPMETPDEKSDREHKEDQKYEVQQELEKKNKQKLISDERWAIDFMARHLSDFEKAKLKPDAMSYLVTHREENWKTDFKDIITKIEKEHLKNPSWRKLAYYVLFQRHSDI